MPLPCYICGGEYIRCRVVPLLLRFDGLGPSGAGAESSPADDGRHRFQRRRQDGVYGDAAGHVFAASRGDYRILARGAFSITLQQTVIGALARGEFPEKTPSEPDRWNWAHCQVRPAGARQPIELILPDMAGEAVLEEVDHPRTYMGIRRFLTQCCATLGADRLLKPKCKPARRIRTILQ